MVLKSVYLLPHGGIMIPGLEPDRNGEADKLHHEMLKISEEMEQDDIKLVFMTSPHGYSHPTDYLVYFHDVFEGTMETKGLVNIYKENDEQEDEETNGDVPNSVQQLLFQGNTQVAQILYQVLRESKLPASPLVLAEPNYPLKLAWGEIIPLSYMTRKYNKMNIVIFSIPMIIAMQEEDETVRKELTAVGDMLQIIANSPMLEKINVSVVISGDMSHKHDENHTYGFHKNAAIFDKKASNWAQQPTDKTWLELLSLHSDAASCGIYGMGVIQGIIDASKNGWKNDRAVYACPSYFGMLVASWKPTNK